MKIIKLKKFVMKQRVAKLPNGRILKMYPLEHPGSVVILALKGNKILVEKQYRPVVNKWLYEIPAGKREKGESFEECVRRELVEETGYYPKNVKKLFSSYPSPGYTTETQHFFLATELQKRKENPMEEELIKIKEVSIDEAIKMIEKKKIEDGKTIQALLFYKFLLTEKNKKYK